MTKKEHERIAGLLDNWRQDAKPEATDKPATFAVDIVAVLTSIVNTYQPGPEEIQLLLQEAFTHVVIVARERGRDEGKYIEQQTNPAIKSAGECVRVAREAERKALRETLRTVFDAECTRGTNPLYAFNEALKAIE